MGVTRGHQSAKASGTKERGKARHREGGGACASVLQLPRTQRGGEKIAQMCARSASGRNHSQCWKAAGQGTGERGESRGMHCPHITLTARVACCTAGAASCVDKARAKSTNSKHTHARTHTEQTRITRAPGHMAARGAHTLSPKPPVPTAMAPATSGQTRHTQCFWCVRTQQSASVTTHSNDIGPRQLLRAQQL